MLTTAHRELARTHKRTEEKCTISTVLSAPPEVADMMIKSTLMAIVGIMADTHSNKLRRFHARSLAIQNNCETKKYH